MDLTAQIAALTALPLGFPQGQGGLYFLAQDMATKLAGMKASKDPGT
jgi:hypothetical protein